MTDRELLEYAAKAAGIHPHDIECTWNPLTDDGDALRLAVKCGISDLALAVGKMVFTCSDIPEDNFAAVRLAIVRAAAEIGKATK